MAANTSRLKTFAQATRTKLISLITAKLDYLLSTDNAEIRSWAPQIAKLREEIEKKGKREVIEEVAYTWFNRIMALRYMDANGFNSPMVVSIAEGQTRPQILVEGMSGNIEDDLNLKAEEKLLTGPALYRKLLVAFCNRLHEPMPFLFEYILGYTEMLLPDDLLSEQSFVTDIRNGMTDEDCRDVEVIGWLYQFYINDRKDEAEKNKSRRGGLKSDEQAAATQLFTPHWIVRYMVENSLGRIWMTLHPDSKLIEEMPYYIAPVEGQIDVIPEDIKSVEDIKFLDPCMGSGHILVYAFDLLTKMYEEEGFATKKIPGLIFENNLFGLDIDPRCYQLASFALTMKARAYYSRFLRRPVQPKVMALKPIDRQIIESTGSWPEKSLIWQMENLDTIGSLLKITPDEAAAIKVDKGVWGEETRLMKEEAEFLSRSYHCVVTNPPYLGKGFGEALKNYIQKNYPNSKADTMATFMERCIDFSAPNGKMAMINMQSWMFLSSFEKLRKCIIENYQIDTQLHLGPRTFDELSGDVVQCLAFVLAKEKPATPGIFYRLVDGGNCNAKRELFLAGANRYVVDDQKQFEQIPGTPIAYWIKKSIMDCFENQDLPSICETRCGLATGQNDKYIRFWPEVNLNTIGFNLNRFEVSKSLFKWFPYDKAGEYRKWYGNRDFVFDWSDNGKKLQTTLHPDGHRIWAHNFNLDKIFLPHIGWSDIVGGKGILSFRYYEQGFGFDGSANAIFTDEEYINRIIAFANSKLVNTIRPLLNPTIHFKPGNFFDLPFKNVTIDNKIMSRILSLSKQDWDAHETSWDFKENELVRITKEKGVNLLQSILEYYKCEWGENFFQLHCNEEEINRKFIKIYGLQDELTPDVPLDEVTILQKGEISIEDGKIVWHEDVIIKQFISYLVGCFMGRYSIDRPGLMIANQGQKPEDLDLPQHTIEIDDDGIIPIIEEADFFADDITARVEDAMEILFGRESKRDNLKYIRNAIGMPLREYFFKEYYKDHLAMYSVKGAKRPIYWFFSSKMGDKKKKGVFKALVYMHRMEEDTLSKLHADYVHPYIEKLEREFNDNEKELEREDLPTKRRNELLKLSESLRGKIREVKEFETELVKKASARPTFDLDDGVATNYPKFYPLVETIKGLDTKDD